MRSITLLCFSTSRRTLLELALIKMMMPAMESDEESLREAYPAYFGSYAEFGKVREWLDRFPNLYCIGRNGQHRYNNMDHSMMCGIEAVRALLDETDKASIWNVNIESGYHEA